MNYQTKTKTFQDLRDMLKGLDAPVVLLEGTRKVPENDQAR